MCKILILTPTLRHRGSPARLLGASLPAPGTSTSPTTSLTNPPSVSLCLKMRETRDAEGGNSPAGRTSH